MVVHSISPHFFHSGFEAVTAVVGLAAVGAGSWEEAFPQDKSAGMKQETPSILLVKRRRFRTWREYDNAQTHMEPLTRFRMQQAVHGHLVSMSGQRTRFCLFLRPADGR